MFFVAISSCKQDKTVALTGKWIVGKMEVVQPEGVQVPADIFKKDEAVGMSFQFNQDSTVVVSDGKSEPEKTRYSVVRQGKDTYVVFTGTVTTRWKVAKLTADKLDLQYDAGMSFVAHCHKS